MEAQRILDGMFAPLAERLAAAVPIDAPLQVLDVGCGTGAVSLALAARLGATGHCTGVDISAPMIAMARERGAAMADRVDFKVADAQQHAFPAGSFDRIVSRFGVMFFADPVQAFRNLHRATRDGGSVQLLAWRSAAENPFMTAAERAAEGLLDLPVRAPDAPGQFAFADADRVRSLLQDSGWRDIALTPIDVACHIALDDLPTYAALLGPVGSALRNNDLDAATRARVSEAVLGGFAPFVHGDTVRYTAACWEITAHMSSFQHAVR